MQLTGNHILNAPTGRIWTILMDPDRLARIVPGVSKLERISDNSFRSILNIRIGPMSGSFTGQLQLEDIVENQSFTIKAQQDSKVGKADADVKLKLSSVDAMRSSLTFSGDVKIYGLLATMGQRVIGGVANTLTKEFFNNLEKELQVQE